MKTEQLKHISPKELGVSNKDIDVNKICGIRIKKFRNMKDKVINLSDQITVVSGHNGTMKSTLIGLFVQPFNSDEEDIFGTPLKTQYSDIFKLSPEHDKEKYEYDVIIEDTAGLNIKIPVHSKPRSKNDPRIRMVTGGNSKKDGNLIYNTNYLNLNRLFSIVTSNASPFPVKLSDSEKKFVSEFYNIVFQKESYNDVETVTNKTFKKTFGPANSKYNFESISSGEDNLGRIANSLITFMRIANKNETNSYNGILCIDEIEASLHPVAQISLIDYLFKWSKKYKVQILVNTHSLPLIRHVSQLAKEGKNYKNYYLSTLYSDDIQVISNPNYETIYKELTFDYEEPIKAEIPRIALLCEDKLAVKFMKYMITKTDIINRINFIIPDDGEGLPYKFLIKLCNSASSYLSNTIVVFDADVQIQALKKIKRNENIIQLPDNKLQLPIEKLLVYYLFECEKDHEVFLTKLKMPKQHFLRSLYKSNININDKSDITGIPTQKFKKWFNDNPIIVNKSFNYFAKNVTGREEFVSDLVDKLNKINIINGYPLIDYQNK